MNSTIIAKFAITQFQNAYMNGEMEFAEAKFGNIEQTLNQGCAHSEVRFFLAF